MAETAEERRTVGRGWDYEETKKTNKENGTSSEGDRWEMKLKGFFIAFAVIALSYNILVMSSPRPSQFSVITNVPPQHCGLKLSAKLQNLILDKHNEIRSKVALGQYVVDDSYLPPAANMLKLNWDCGLELEAQNRAEQCDLGMEKQSGLTGGLEEVRGENAFYFRTEDVDSVEGAVVTGIERMGDEIAIAGIKEMKLARYDKRIGHATQIMWGTTRTVGCAVRECSARQDGSLDGQKYNVAVCKYYPTGNVFKSSAPTAIYSSGESGSRCSDGFLVDPTSGLCVTATWQERGEERTL
ncbi:unnamed protein product [Caenorhabditis sp. 36 PRJEB53466]|nr:unnamed protein product [Caenorhabditis sp. 36 PRJEB53466]